MEISEEDLYNVQIFLSVMAELKVEVLVFPEPESTTKHVYFRGDFDYATHKYISGALAKLKRPLVIFLEERLRPATCTNFQELLQGK